MKVYQILICGKCKEPIYHDGWCPECEHTCDDHYSVKMVQIFKNKVPAWVKQYLVRESGLLEEICQHGVGHPERESVKEMDKIGLKGFGIHGCDGCCSPKMLKAIKAIKK